MEYDYLFKLLLIGDAGKTAIMFRFSDGDAFTTAFKCTIAVDYKIRTIELDGKKIKLVTWDTPAHEGRHHIITSYYRGAQGIMIVYDITREKTFESIKKWMRNIEENTSSNVVKILVGNKCHKENRRSVSKERGAQLAAEYGMKFLEVSAKKNINIDEAFYTLARDLKRLVENRLKQLRLQARLEATSSKWVVRRPKQSKGLFSAITGFALNFGRKSATPQRSSSAPSDDTQLKEQQLNASGIKVKELPDEVIHKLEKFYSRENNWEQLARLIGFSLEFIQRLKGYPEGGTARLLIQWGESEPDVTVFELYTMLKQLGIDRAADVLLLVPLTIQSSTALVIQSQQENTLTLPCDILQTLQSPCPPQKVVVQLQEHLQLNQSSLNEPDPETKKWIRCLATEGKRSNRLDVVQHLRDISPAGTTGPLFPKQLDIQDIPVHQMRELTIDLSGGDKWIKVAKKLGLSPKQIRYLEKRIMDPCDEAHALISERCYISVGEMYDLLNECGLPVVADNL